MKNKKNKEYFEIAEKAIMNPNEVYLCPLNQKHTLDVKVKEYLEWGKLEISIKCLRCNTDLVLTKDIKYDASKQIEVSQDILDDIKRLKFKQ